MKNALVSVTVAMGCLLVAGCGGSSQGAQQASADQQQQLVTSIVEKTRSTVKDPGQLDCLKAEWSTWNVAWLQYLNDHYDGSLANAPSEMRDRLAKALARCITAAP